MLNVSTAIIAVWCGLCMNCACVCVRMGPIDCAVLTIIRGILWPMGSRHVCVCVCLCGRFVECQFTSESVNWKLRE